MNRLLQRRFRPYAQLRVCDDGHVEPIPGTEQMETELICHGCFEWTLDANFCGWCGKKLRAS